MVTCNAANQLGCMSLTTHAPCSSCLVRGYIPGHVSFEDSGRKHLYNQCTSVKLESDNSALHGNIFNIKACIIECVAATCYANCKKLNGVTIIICKKLNGETIQ